MSRLVVFSGMPGVGKSTIARALAQRAGMIWLRVDSIETALAESTLNITRAEDAGYCAALAVARDNLTNGLDVIADMVNENALTRGLWADVGTATGAQLLNVHLICSDEDEHRRRVEGRSPGPTWATVQSRVVDPWDNADLTIDTAQHTPQESTTRVLQQIGSLRPTRNH